MATGRTLQKFMRVYVDAVDLSGYARSLGPLTWEFEEHDLTGISGAVKGFLPGQATVNPGTLNALFDNTASGLHALMNGAGVMRTVMAPIGIRAEPAEGDPCFMGQFEQKEYIVDPSDGSTAITASFDASAAASTLLYARPWGSLLHVRGAETAENSGTGIDDSPAGASTAKGGYMVYHIYASNAAGTVVVSVEDAVANNDGSFGALVDCETSAIGFAAIAAGTAHGLVAIAPTATVKQFTRWQIALAGGMTSCSFALAFVRGSL